MVVARLRRHDAGDSRGERPPNRPHWGVALLLPAAAALVAATGMVAAMTAVRARVARSRLRLPGRARRRCSASTSDRAGRAGRAARAQRRRQDDARAAPQRHPRAGGPARCASAGCRSSQGALQGDPPPGRHRVPGPRRPALHADRRATTSRSARRTSASRARSSTTACDAALHAVGMEDVRRPAAPPPQLRAAPARGASPPCWRCEPEILVLDEPSSNLDPASRARARRHRAGASMSRC